MHERVDINRGRTRRRKQVDKSQLRRDRERMKDGRVDQNNEEEKMKGKEKKEVVRNAAKTGGGEERGEERGE